MRSLRIIAALICVALFAGNINARNDGEMQESGDCNEFKPKYKVENSVADEFDGRATTTSGEINPRNRKYLQREFFKRDFQPRPSATSYVGHHRDQKSFVKDFEPRPSATSYVGDHKPKDDEHVQDFEPRPNVSAYTDDVKPTDNKSYTNDFEPRPNVSAYTDDVKPTDKKSSIKDFEPRPNVSAYTDDAKKSYMKDFEPRPNVFTYKDNAIGVKTAEKDSENQPKGYAFA